MSEPSHSYVIRGGIEGRERLRVLAAIMEPTTRALFARLPVRVGDRCWDVGCGGGDVSALLADLVGPTGWVLGTDIDPVKVELAEAERGDRPNICYRVADAMRETPSETFDLAHARYLLSHLTDPAGTLAAIRSALRPGALLVVEDVDFSAPLCDPDRPAFRRYHDLYTRTAQSRGADPLIGPRLPALLRATGVTDVQIFIHQPAGFDHAPKHLSVLTLEGIAPIALTENLTTPAELEDILTDLRAAADDPAVLLGCPRIVQAWGRVP
ncbi:methyltransferase domain-containing protein [Nocardia sp. CDC159]|uniref:Methyltransferase domain-containing protein n=1 Tax=Nocardia pulmonis TaxID=2951408 RepID=A0A9X2J2I0_9NOCA|nr:MULTISPECIES: methyltransferase domain-containing protein [Nocardia]MCM6778061.1 methyltransferase domain-containing protein [Nocardia pulmonis]MCM6790950.1 methyltransferase domain-containing protein [Nocardia sp. CDC159]